jgi:hypothetical protein
VEYHLPQAKWAQHLLDLLARYEKKRRRQEQHPALDAGSILAQHLAWQSERQALSSALTG